MRQLKRQVIVQLLKQHQYTYPNASSVHCSHERPETRLPINPVTGSL